MLRCKPSSKSQEQRKKPKRQQNRRILIVCEGQNTEFFYFKSFKQAIRLPSVEVKILSMGKNSSPINIVKSAQNQLRQQEFDHAYCVFDKDRHPSYEQACNQETDILRIVRSIPCFEIWVLLHFEYTNRVFHAAQSGSVSKPIIQAIQKYLHQYSKSEEMAKNLYWALAGQLDQALKRAKKLREHNQDQGTLDPYTDIDLLITELEKLKLGTSHRL